MQLRKTTVGYNRQCNALSGNVNPLECRGSYIATSNNMQLVHWPLMGGLLFWYSEEGTGRGPSPPRPLFAAPNVTAHRSTASVPITVLLYNGPLLCGFNVPFKGLRKVEVILHPVWNRINTKTSSLLFGQHCHAYQVWLTSTAAFVSYFGERPTHRHAGITFAGKLRDRCLSTLSVRYTGPVLQKEPYI